MKIALLADYYEQYLAAYDSLHAQELAPLGFRQHQEHFFSDYFGSFVSYRNHFRHIGHQAELFVANYYPLQAKWLQEQSSNLAAAPNTKKLVLLEQLRAFRPDAVFVGSMFDYYGEFFQQVSRITKNIFTWISCPFPPNLDLSNVRCVFSSIKDYVYKFQKLGVPSEWLRAAFDPEILPKLGSVQKDVPVSFVGALARGSHESRIAALEYLLRAGIPLKIWGNYSYTGRRAALKGLFVKSPLEKHTQPSVWGLEMYRTLARSQITVNAHIDVAKQNRMGGNMRLYEATGCGALLITDDAPDVRELFEVGSELITYQSKEELFDHIRFFLEHPESAKTIANAGREGCVRRHSYSARIREFSQMIEVRVC